jgi:hypothetical protein
MSGFISTEFVELVRDMLVGNKEYHMKNFLKCINEMNEYKAFQTRMSDIMYDIFEYDFLEITTFPSGIVAFRKVDRGMSDYEIVKIVGYNFNLLQ